MVLESPLLKLIPYPATRPKIFERSNRDLKSFYSSIRKFTKLYCIESFNLDDCAQMGYYYFKQAAMVKLVDTLLLGSSARASRFESEWRHHLLKGIK